jgi:RecB family exonuclease
MPVRFVSHPDPRVLFEWLRAELARSAGSAPLAPVRIVVPNRRLAGEVRRRLAQGGRAYLGLRVVDFGALAAEVLDRWAGTEGEFRIAPEVVLRQVLLRCLEREGGVLAAHARRRAGVAARLLAAFQEMREAEVSAEDAASAPAAGDDPVEREIPRLYRRYLEALQGLERGGRADRAGFVARAAAGAGSAQDPAAPVWGGHGARLFLYGAYEVIGIHRSLLRALARRALVTVLLPLDERTPAWRHGREFAERFLLQPGESIEYLQIGCESPWAQAASALYDEERGLEPGGAGARADLPARFELFHAQGAEAEITAVARRILDLAAGGSPLSEIGVVGRGLEEYAPHLERVFDAHGIPFSTSARQPLARFPAPAALLSLLRLLEHDFDREDLLDLLRSPAVSWGEDARPRADLLEVWSAEAGVRKGLGAWIEDVLGWQREVALRPQPEESEGGEPSAARAERWLRNIEEQRRILEGLGGEAEEWKRCAPGAARAAFLGALAERWIDGLGAGSSADPALAVLQDVLEELRQAALVDPAQSGEQTLALLRGLIEGRDLPLRDADRGGVRVLDGMQARGHLFEHLFIIGLNAGRFPRPLAEDPFLPEEARRRLRDQRRLPLPLRRNDAEERQLLALWLASCSGRLCVSYQRAGEDGRALVASPALREVARLIGGRPRVSDLAEEEALVPVHPQRRIVHWSVRPRIVSPAEAALLAALGRGDRQAGVREALAGRPEWGEPLQCGLRWMARRRTRWQEEEGRVPPSAAGILPARWSPSALQLLAGCPLRYFFERILKVEPRLEPPEDGGFDPADWGGRVHALLEDVFRTLGRDDLLKAAPPSAGPNVEERHAARCRDLVEGAWEQHFGDLGRRVSRRLGLLWEEAEAGWRAALTAFVVRQLEEWRRDGLELLDLEREVEADVSPLGGGEAIPLRGRVDRVVLASGRKRVGDYKSGRTLEGLGEPLQMLRGQMLQAPLYAWIESVRSGGIEPVDVEFLGVGPHHPPEEDESRLLVEHEELERWRAGVEESVRVLVGQAGAGAFPFRHGNGCECCQYESACHHRDRAARSIVESAPAHAGYFALLRKTQNAPLLEDARGPAAAESPEEEP